MKPVKLLTLLSISAGCLVQSPVSSAQDSPSGQTPSKSKAAVPVTMTECESHDKCATWTFLGTQGNGQGANGEVENLSVEKFDANSVVIHRADSTGPSAGLTADYTGTRQGNRIEGKFTSTWPDHWDSMSSKWSATVGTTTSEGAPAGQGGANAGLDGKLIGRWGAGDGFLVFTFDDGKTMYGSAENTSGGYQHIFRGKYSGSDDIDYTLTRIDPRGCRTNTTGHIHLVDKNNASTSQQGWNGCGVSTSNITGHLTRAAGSAAQPQPQQQLVVCVPWFFTVVCGR